MRFGDQLQMFICVYEIHNGDSLQQQTLQAPRMMHEQQFMSLVQQAMGCSSPVRIFVKRTEPFYDKGENKWHEKEYTMEYMNAEYVRLNIDKEEHTCTE